MRGALIAPLLLLLLVAPTVSAAGDEIFERDLSTPFLRDDDDRFLRDRDLPGPLRKSWPYADAPEGPFKAVEARRACHARALFEFRRSGRSNVRALARLESRAMGKVRYRVDASYETRDDQRVRQAFVTCQVSSQRVTEFSLEWRD